MIFFTHTPAPIFFARLPMVKRVFLGALLLGCTGGIRGEVAAPPALIQESRPPVHVAAGTRQAPALQLRRTSAQASEKSKVASVEELAQEMTRIMQLYASSGMQAEGFVAQFIPLPRFNQLLVIRHSEAVWTYVKRWPERIDPVGEGPGRRIFIYPVENGKATDLRDILNQVLGVTLPTPEARPQEQLRIVPDPATNSLIIYATAREFQNIRNILKELDVMPQHQGAGKPSD